MTIIDELRELSKKYEYDEESRRQQNILNALDVDALRYEASNGRRYASISSFDENMCKTMQTMASKLEQKNGITYEMRHNPTTIRGDSGERFRHNTFRCTLSTKW